MKAIRIRTRDGEIRLCSFGGHDSLPSFWFEAKAVGHVVGENWAMPFDNIALMDVIEIADQAAAQLSNDPERQHQIDRLAQGIAAGAWKPPSE